MQRYMILYYGRMEEGKGWDKAEGGNACTGSIYCTILWENWEGRTRMKSRGHQCMHRYTILYYTILCEN